MQGVKMFSLAKWSLSFKGVIQKLGEMFSARGKVSNNRHIGSKHHLMSSSLQEFLSCSSPGSFNQLRRTVKGPDNEVVINLWQTGIPSKDKKHPQTLYAAETVVTCVQICRFLARKLTYSLLFYCSDAHHLGFHGVINHSDPNTDPTQYEISNYNPLNV